MVLVSSKWVIGWLSRSCVCETGAVAVRALTSVDAHVKSSACATHERRHGHRRGVPLLVRERIDTLAQLSKLVVRTRDGARHNEGVDRMEGVSWFTRVLICPSLRASSRSLARFVYEGETQTHEASPDYALLCPQALKSKPHAIEMTRYTTNCRRQHTHVTDCQTLGRFTQCTRSCSK